MTISTPITAKPASWLISVLATHQHWSWSISSWPTSTKNRPSTQGSESTLESAIRVRDAARAAGIPVIFTRVVFTPGGVDGGLFYRKVPSLYLLDEGSPLNELPVELSPDPGDLVIKKQYASAFFGTTLASTLNSLGVDTVIITGLTTSGCIRATAVDALQHGFVPMWSGRRLVIETTGCTTRTCSTCEPNTQTSSLRRRLSSIWRTARGDAACEATDLRRGPLSTR